MAAHHCPRCRAFSWHGPGSAHWALRCPFCGTVSAQVPHDDDLPPLPLPGSPLVTEPELAELVPDTFALGDPVDDDVEIDTWAVVDVIEDPDES